MLHVWTVVQKEQRVHLAHIFLYARMLSCGKLENLASGFQSFFGVCDRISKDILKDKNGFQTYMSLERNAGKIPVVTHLCMTEPQL
jgi:hypothetical protein